MLMIISRVGSRILNLLDVAKACAASIRRATTLRSGSHEMIFRIGLPLSVIPYCETVFVITGYPATTRLSNDLARIRPAMTSLRAKRSNPFFLCLVSWILRFAAMTMPYTQFKRDLVRAFSRRFARGFLRCPSKGREQGMPDARCTRGLVCKLEEDAHEHTGSAEALRHSLRNGFTAYDALSPENRALLSPSPADSWLIRARSGRLAFRET